MCVPDCAFGFAQPIGDVAVFQNNPKLQNLDASGTKVHGKTERIREFTKKEEMQALKNITSEFLSFYYC